LGNYAIDSLLHCPPIKHHFTDGVYVRGVLQRDSCYVKIHKTEHQFFEGECIVWIDGVEKILKAHPLVLLRQEHSALFMLQKIKFNIY
jgi:hypothetical protein